MTDIDSIVERFNQIRIYFEYKQSEFADKLNTTQANIAKIQAKKGAPNLEIVSLLITKLNISPAYLFYGVGPIQNEEWDMLLEVGLVEKKVLSKLQNAKETSLYKTIFSTFSTSISIQIFLCVFFKKIGNIKDVQPDGAKQKLLDLLLDFEKEYSNFSSKPSNTRYLSKKDREAAIAFVQENFDDDEAYFMLKNAKKIQKEIKEEIPHIHKIFNC
jgi:transcriptional regulator with XRE-family HTH domain